MYLNRQADRATTEPPDPDGPLSWGAEWFDCVLFEDFDTAWTITDPSFRLALAQQWVIDTGRGRDQPLAQHLAFAEPAPGSDWAQFSRDQLDRWLGAFRPAFNGSFRLLEDEAELVGPDLGVIAVAPDESPNEVSEADDRPITAQHLVMRLTNQWRVAGLGRSFVRPGWPPTQVPLLPPGG